MATLIYTLCALLALAGAGLLFNGYRASRWPLLFWSGMCFLGLTLNNILVVIDLQIVPELDLGIARAVTALLGMCMLLYGLVFASDRSSP